MSRGKRPDPKRYMLNYPIYTKFTNRQNKSMVINFRSMVPFREGGIEAVHKKGSLMEFYINILCLDLGWGKASIYT